MNENIQTMLIAGVIVILIVTIIISSILSYFKKKVSQQESKIREQDLIIQRDNSQKELEAKELAETLFNKFKQTELERYITIIRNAEIEKAHTQYQGWIRDYEKLIREDAKKRSTSSLLGKITEHLIPFSDYFNQFNPKDARFIGSPIDLIVFDGMADNKPQITIHFVEIKTGSSALSALQKKIQSAVENKRVEWLRISLKGLQSDLENIT